MAASIWVKVKGGRQPIELSTANLRNVYALIRMVKDEARLDGVRLDQLQLYQSEETTAEERSRCNCFVVSKFRVKGIVRDMVGYEWVVGAPVMLGMFHLAHMASCNGFPVVGCESELFLL